MNYWNRKGLYQADWERFTEKTTRAGITRPCLRDLYLVAEAYMIMMAFDGAGMPQECARYFDPVDSKAKPNQGFSKMRLKRMRANSDVVIDRYITLALREEQRNQ